MEKDVESKMRVAVEQFLIGELLELLNKSKGGDDHQLEHHVKEPIPEEVVSTSKGKAIESPQSHDPYDDSDEGEGRFVPKIELYQRGEAQNH